ncbi:MAG UNVERIFIED_CONTAM: hypothetical protein LVR29_13815 [Microcystis novacekii LVE1205-3]|jgi:phosphoglycerol transferase MdoB-like AlkP superfamily enzyme
MSSREQHFQKINLVVLLLVLALIAWVDWAELPSSLLFYPSRYSPNSARWFINPFFSIALLSASDCLPF